MDGLNHLKGLLHEGRRTLLCAGPMSRNCIDAAAELTRHNRVPVVLIASRRQIDAESSGGGYVDGFTTEQFARYVESQDAPLLFMARDHGGPWQGNRQDFANLDEAMRDAKASFETDIRCGFSFVHIDASMTGSRGTLSVDAALERVFELYAHCFEYAGHAGRRIEFEVGTEEQKSCIERPDEFEYLVSRITRFCEERRMQKPLFVVAQTGAKVMEMRNVGLFATDPEAAVLSLTGQAEGLLGICRKYGVLLKEHNADYLSNTALLLRPVIGIHASNVAPEFGVAETRALLAVLRAGGLKKEFDDFVGIALASRKWVKWMLPDSLAGDVDKALICGHYVFAHPGVREIRDRADAWLRTRRMTLDGCLKSAVKARMLRYLQLFQMLP